MFKKIAVLTVTLAALFGLGSGAALADNSADRDPCRHCGVTKI